MGHPGHFAASIFTEQPNYASPHVRVKRQHVDDVGPVVASLVAVTQEA
jgi:hypothetical protein